MQYVAGFGALSLSYEYNFAHKQSIVFYVEKAQYGSLTERENGTLVIKGGVKGIGILPEYRYYYGTSSRFSSASGLFIGVYSRIATTNDFEKNYLTNENTEGLDQLLAGAGVSTGIKYLDGDILGISIDGLYNEFCIGFGYGFAGSQFIRDEGPLAILSAFSRMEMSIGFAF